MSYRNELEDEYLELYNKLYGTNITHSRLCGDIECWHVVSLEEGIEELKKKIKESC